MGLQIDALVCDLDGVVYRGGNAIDGAAEALGALRERGVRLLFATNNSRYTVEEYVVRLDGFGVAAEADEIVTSGVVLEAVLKGVGVDGMGALVVGGTGLRTAVEAAGAHVVEDPREAGLVAVGWDVDFTYEKMKAASLAVQAGALFYASNKDATFPATDGTLWPGAGAIVASIEAAGGRHAISVGKPTAPMAEFCERRLSGASNIAAIGDRPDTDLALGKDRGWTTILVTSGIISPDAVSSVDPTPDLVLGSIAELPALLDDRANR
ncbi:MAG: HAD-IIA family hydrolase [Actinobacteria bacterium]|jgi:4-nitrophenyl phosphatase|nr:HAD-IIA family hydrolase [Actinomycetota bacterium]